MPKNRMGVLDVRAATALLRSSALGSRVANIYDLNPKTYLFKLAKTEQKILLLMESGVRFHPTQYARDKSTIPSGFTLKLRKHIRTKRLEDVRQLGADRVIDFTFGSGDAAHHVILELFAGGNIILTDSSYSILSLLRSHTDETTGLRYGVKENYPAALSRASRPASAHVIREWLGGGEEGEKAVHVLMAKSDYGPALVEHAFLTADVSESITIGQILAPKDDGDEGDNELLTRVVAAFEEIDRLLSDKDLGGEGFVFTEDERAQRKKKLQNKKKGGAKGGEGEEGGEGGLVGGGGEEGEEGGELGADVDKTNLKFDDFSPVLLAQYKHRKYVRYASFSASLDEYFAKIEGQRLDAQRQQQESAAMRRVDRARQEHEQRLTQLLTEKSDLEENAQLIENNLSSVDNAIVVVNAMIARGMGWGDVKTIIKQEQRGGNPVANLIHRVMFEQNTMTLLLTNNFDAQDEEEQTKPAKPVEVDLSLNAYGNAQQYYSQQKKVASKEAKTREAGSKAIQGAERKAKEELKKVETVGKISAIRKPFWFEKFHWFVSSENYIVVAGRDMQQNEMIVKRYLDRDDVYVHADIHGAASCVIKNHSGGPIPDLTLAEAGSFCVCRSAAWDNKIVTSAYWVHAHQVSKSAPSGEYLTTGSFMIRGKRNFLPPNQLVMGVGLLFKVDESSVPRHVDERRVRSMNEDELASQRMLQSRQEDDDEEDDTMVLINENEETPAAKPHQQNQQQQQHHQKQQHQQQQVDGIGAEGGGDNEELQEVIKERHGGKSDKGKNKHKQQQMHPKEEKDDDEDDDDEEDEEEEEEEEEEPAKPAVVEEKLPKGRGRGGGGVTRVLSDSGFKVSMVGMDAFDDDEDEDDGQLPAALRSEGGDGEGGGPKRHMSAAERRRLKKGGKKGKDDDNEDDEDDDDDDSDRKQNKNNKNNNNKGKKDNNKNANEKEKSAPPAAVPRGKKKKLQKMKDKYGDQDDDERELMLNIIGSRGEEKGRGRQSKEERKAVRPKSAAAQAKIEQQQQKIAEAAIPEESAAVIIQRLTAADNSKKCWKCGADDHLATACPQNRGRTAAKKEARKEKEEVAALLSEEGIVELSEELKAQLTEVNSLTGQPVDEDVTLFAIPVVAPYSTLQKYAYKIKLIPGSQRKGKAGKAAIEHFLKTAAARSSAGAKEKELIKAINDNELVAVMINNVRLVTAQDKGGKGKK